MSDYRVCGHVVERVTEPRFRVVFTQQDDGSWVGTRPEFIDSPKLNAARLARLMREAGDYFARNRRVDWIQRMISARARELKMNARMICDATGGAVGQNHLRDYLNDRASLGSHKLAAVLRVLGLTVTIENEKTGD